MKPEKVADSYDEAFSGCQSIITPGESQLFFTYISSIYNQNKGGKKR